MPRDDYEKFLEIGQAELGNKYYLDYFKNNDFYLQFAKIKKNADIRELERIFWQELGTREDYERTYLRQDRYKLYGGNIAAFLRSIIGVDMHVAIDKFIALIQTEHLTAMQEEYLRNIIRYVCENGDIERSTMQHDPFRTYDWFTVFGPAASAVPKYIEQLHHVIAVAQ